MILVGIQKCIITSEMVFSQKFGFNSKNVTENRATGQNRHTHLFTL